MSSGTLTRGSAALGAAPMDPRLRARRAQVARARGRRRLRRLLALVSVTVLVVGAVALTRSPLLDVDHVHVEGAVRSDDAAVRDAAGIETGVAMVSVDEEAAQARLAELPWVAGAEVTRRWPGTVEVSLRERIPVAVAGSGPRAVLVDAEGRVLGPVTGARGLPAVADVVPGEPGSTLDRSDRALVALVAGLPADLRRQVDRASADPGDGVAVVLRDGIAVRFCDDTRLGAKSAALRALLERAGRSSIERIDLCVTPASLTRRPGSGS